MACFKPIGAFYSKNADKKIQFKPHSDTAGERINLPCGRCIGCRIDYVYEWVPRILHECSLHENNQFVSATYSPEFLPKMGDLHYPDMQDFYQKIRDNIGPFRYFTCAEYGSKDRTFRPHYHSVMFGLQLDDLKQRKKNNNGDPLYESETLTQLWGRGNVIIGAVTPSSAAYVASYHLKSTDAKHDDAYQIRDFETGEILYQYQKPFVRMSKGSGSGKGGIGAAWYSQFKDDAFPKGYVTHQGRKFRTPDYYMRLLEADDPELYAKLKLQQRAWTKTKEAQIKNSDRALARREKFHHVKREKYNRERKAL